MNKLKEFGSWFPFFLGFLAILGMVALFITATPEEKEYTRIQDRSLCIWNWTNGQIDQERCREVNAQIIAHNQKWGTERPLYICK